MAFYSTTAGARAPRVTAFFTAGFTAAFRAIGRGLTTYIDARARTGEIQRLNALTDAELRDIGLRRDDIPRHVFPGLRGYY